MSYRRVIYEKKKARLQYFKHLTSDIFPYRARIFFLPSLSTNIYPLDKSRKRRRGKQGEEEKVEYSINERLVCVCPQCYS